MNTAIHVEEARRLGALRCVEAMRQLEANATNRDMPDDPRGWLLRRRTDAEKLVKALGPMPPETEGAVLALAEYMHYSQTAGGANLEPGHWLPVVALTPDEFESEISRRGQQQTNVIQFARTSAK